jgi:hypothetical protein
LSTAKSTAQNQQQHGCLASVYSKISKATLIKSEFNREWTRINTNKIKKERGEIYEIDRITAVYSRNSLLFVHIHGFFLSHFSILI